MPLHVGGDVTGRHPTGRPRTATATSRTSGRSIDFVPDASPDDLPTCDAECDRAGSRPDVIEMTVGGARTAEEAAAMAELGVDRSRSPSARKEMPEVRDELARFGTEVIEPTTEL